MAIPFRLFNKGAGIFSIFFQKSDVFLYLGYPPNNSSAPSPEIATLTFFLAKLDNKKVGICEGSEKGSS